MSTPNIHGLIPSTSPNNVQKTNGHVSSKETVFQKIFSVLPSFSLFKFLSKPTLFFSFSAVFFHVKVHVFGRGTSSHEMDVGRVSWVICQVLFCSVS